MRRIQIYNLLIFNCLQKHYTFRRKRIYFSLKKYGRFHKKVRTFSQKSTDDFAKKYGRFHKKVRTVYKKGTMVLNRKNIGI